MVAGDTDSQGSSAYEGGSTGDTGGKWGNTSGTEEGEDDGGDGGAGGGMDGRYLYNNKLSGPIPAELGKCTKLQVL